MDGFFDDDPFDHDFFADKPFNDGVDPRYRNLDDFTRRQRSIERRRQAKYGRRQPTRKRRIRHSAAEMRLPHEVISELSRHGAHSSEWEPVTGQDELYNLRAGEHVRLFHQTRKGWETLSELNGPRGGEQVLAFRRRPGRSSVPAARNHQPRTKPITLSPDTYRRFSSEPEPDIFVRSPVNDTLIQLDDYRFGRRQLEWYEFLPGDTAESVTHRFLGYAAPDKVFDGTMRTVADPQPGRSYRVLTGYLITIEGSVTNTPRVEVVWSGPTQGRRILGGRVLGSTSWSTEIPVRPGHYRLVARIDEGRSYQVDFEVVDNTSTRWARTRGMAKALVNQTWRNYSADMIEGTGQDYDIQVPGEPGRRRVTAKELAELYRRQGSDLLRLSDPAEAAGAQTVRDNPQAPLLIGAITALGSHGKSLLRHPDEFIGDLKRALTHSRSETEALGELGMHQAKRRLDIETDPRYVNRYHGPDEIGLDGKQGNRLTETEAKASRDDRVRVATNKGKRKQGSAKNNRKRAEMMKKKEMQGKVGQPSNRQGGPYLEGEMELYQEIRDLGGEKQHLLVHTNTSTGMVKTFVQVDGGKIGKKLDEFEMENFKEAKAMIEAHFTNIKEQIKK